MYLNLDIAQQAARARGWAAARMCDVDDRHAAPVDAMRCHGAGRPIGRGPGIPGTFILKYYGRSMTFILLMTSIVINP
eukprot:SAG31_NODE_980_length_10594_cov_7.565889_8_plen_78_part_00